MHLQSALAAAVGGLFVLVGWFAAPALPSAEGRNTALGLDHIPVAVRDLERAAATFRRLGFALKPGRPHANGIRNVHVKFPDGSGIELLTAPRPQDELSLPTSIITSAATELRVAWTLSM